MRVRVSYPPKFGRRLCEKILCICHHRRASSEVACKKKLAREFGLPHFLLSPKIKNFRGPCLIGYLCGSSPMKKTILDLLHSNESKRNPIYSITQRYIRLNKNKGLVEPLVLI